jgi:uncharacterized protein (DUF2267 family)
VNQKIVSSQVIDPVRITHSVLAVLASHVTPGEVEKLKDAFPKDLQNLWAEVPSE